MGDTTISFELTPVYPPKPALADMARAIADVSDAIEAYRQGWETRDTALVARIAELEASVPPKPASTLFGSSQPENVPHDGRTQLLPVTRAYLSDSQKPTSYLASASLKTRVQAASDAVILSWKALPGQWLDDLLGSLEGTGLTVYGCQNHEPYDNFWPGNLAEFHARWDTAESIMRNHAHVVPTLILDGTRESSWEAFARPTVPVWGMDRYNPGIQTPKAYMPPAEVFGPYLAWADRAGKRKLIGETGTGLVAGSPESDRAQWAAEAHRVLEAGEVEAAAWWYSGALQCPLETFLAWLLG